MMPFRLALCAVFIGLLLLWMWGCAEAPPPASVNALSEMANNPSSEELASAAPGAWAEAKRYLALANQASEAGDSEQADRFAELGFMHAKIARVSAEQAAIAVRAAEEEKRNQALQKEIGEVTTALNAFEARMARVQMRRHLVQVVGETRLKAAAEEEVREQLLTKADRSAQHSARQQVGAEMMARALVWRDIVDMLVTRGALTKGEEILVNGPLQLASERLDANDLFGVLQYVEESGIEAWRLIDAAWQREGLEPKQILREVIENIKSAGFEMADDELGPVVLLKTDVVRPAKEKWTERLALLGSLIGPFKQVSCLLLVSHRAHRDKEKEVIDAARKVLDQMDLLADRVLVKSVGEASPIAAQRTKGEHLAVLLVPLPKAP